jgi:hypothetical protein
MNRHEETALVRRALATFALCAVALCAVELPSGDALAQDTAPAPAPAAPAPAPAAPALPANAVPQVYGVVAPPPAGVPIGGGNATESSARPVQGDKEDTFDYGRSTGSGTAYGDSNGPVFLGREPSQVLGGPAVGGVPGIHVVRRGDTLWGICDQYFQNPYQWPRIWSFNPQLQNPHWIYPGDQIRLSLGNALPTRSMSPGAGNIIEQRRQVAPDTVFLRDEGYVEDEKGDNWGEISGSPEDHLLLGDFDQVYLRVSTAHDVHIGQELTVFRPTRALGSGAIVQIQGTVRVDQWNSKDRVARGQIVETLDAIERGARVGPIPRRFEVVPPKRNDADVVTHVAIASQPHVFFGQNQVVFIDKGSDAGLKLGNRLFVVRHGDAWRQSMVTDQTARRIVGEREDPAVVENTPRMRNEGALPEEVVAELRVVDVQKGTATCMVTRADREVEQNDVAIARKGY